MNGVEIIIYILVGIAAIAGLYMISQLVYAISLIIYNFFIICGGGAASIPALFIGGLYRRLKIKGFAKEAIYGINDEKTGELFENITAKRIKKIINEDVLQNTYLPNGDNLTTPKEITGTTEVDGILVTRKGIFSLECKFNEIGMMRPIITSIDDIKEKWQLSAKTSINISQRVSNLVSDDEYFDFTKIRTKRSGEKCGQYEEIENPFFQNQGHIAALKYNLEHYLHIKNPIIFNTVITNNYFIDKKDGMINSYNYNAVKKDNKILISNGEKGIHEFKEVFESLPDVLTEEEVTKIKTYLQGYKKTPELEKMHMDYIDAKYGPETVVKEKSEDIESGEMSEYFE